jgi:hypothetical protein
VLALTQTLNKKSSVAPVCQAPSRPRTAFCPTPPPWPLVRNFLALLLVQLLFARSCFISAFFSSFNHRAEHVLGTQRSQIAQP